MSVSSDSQRCNDDLDPFFAFEFDAPIDGPVDGPVDSPVDVVETSAVTHSAVTHKRPTAQSTLMGMVLLGTPRSPWHWLQSQHGIYRIRLRRK